MKFRIFVLWLTALLFLVTGSESIDKAGDCHDALHTGHYLATCIQSATVKYKLAETSSFKESCCAMYDALNCAANQSCNVCPHQDLADWAAYRIRAINSIAQTICLDTAYEKCDKKIAFSLNWHCANEPGYTTDSGSSYKVPIILGLIMIAIIIVIAVLGLIVHLLAKNNGDPNKKNATGGGKKPASFGNLLPRNASNSSFKFVPVTANVNKTTPKHGVVAHKHHHGGHKKKTNTIFNGAHAPTPNPGNAISSLVHPSSKIDSTLDSMASSKITDIKSLVTNPKSNLTGQKSIPPVTSIITNSVEPYAPKI